MIVDFFIVAAIGKLGMYLWKKTPYAAWLAQKSKFFEKLFGCDLCLGFWVYSLLAWAYQIRVLDGHLHYIPILDEMITGGVMSLVVFLIGLGWFDQFGTYKVE